VQVNLRGFDFGVSEQVLHGADIRAVFKEVRGEGVPQDVRGNPFRKTSIAGSLGNRLLEGIVGNMVTPGDATPGIPLQA
jgi:hypothetical protein